MINKSAGMKLFPTNKYGPEVRSQQYWVHISCAVRPDGTVTKGLTYRKQETNDRSKTGHKI